MFYLGKGIYFIRIIKGRIPNMDLFIYDFIPIDPKKN